MKKSFSSLYQHYLSTNIFRSSVFCMLFLVYNSSFSQKVTSLKSINSEYDEQSPVLSNDGKTLYFTRSKHPENVAGFKDEGDIWFSRISNKGEWQLPQRMDNVWNNTQRNAVAGFYNQGQSVILMNHYLNSNKFKPGVSVSHLRNGEWSFPQPLGVDYFFNQSSDYHISLNEAGNILIMSLESYGNVGAEDLYVSFIKANGDWSEPLHLGWELNTRFQEMTPYLAADNKTLFFSSNCHSGEGSKDIFVSTRLDDTWKKWSTPKNMGKIINTSGVETNYFQTLDQEYGYFISTQNSEGYGDLMQITLKEDQLISKSDSVSKPTDTEQTEVPVEKTTILLEEPVATDKLWVKARIIDSLSNTPIEATIMVSNGQGLNIEVKADQHGYLALEVSSVFTYQLRIHAKGYFEQNIPWSKSTNIDTVRLRPIEVGTTLQLNHLLFEQGTASIIPTSYPELDKVVNLMLENPLMEIELAGHTDNQGSFKLNLELSQKRVDKVKDYLVDKGIKSSRISGKGYGGTKPIASNQNAESRKLNRRVEMTILKN